MCWQKNARPSAPRARGAAAGTLRKEREAKSPWVRRPSRGGQGYHRLSAGAETASERYASGPARSRARAGWVSRAVDEVVFGLSEQGRVQVLRGDPGRLDRPLDGYRWVPIAQGALGLRG